MSRSRRERVETLKARAEWLKARMDRARGEGKEYGWDKSEYWALMWAMPILEAHVEACLVLQEQLKEMKDAAGR